MTLPVLPTQCAVCRGWDRSRICARCLGRCAAPRPRCARCAIDVAAGIAVCGACLRSPPPFGHAVAAVDYEPPWDGLVARFKFHAALDLAPALAALLADAVRGSTAPRPDLVVAAPVAAGRLRERGYNQAWELARRVARAFDIAADPHVVVRTRDAPHQLDLPPDRRAANVRGVHAVAPRRAARVAGRRVAVVDDVMTTGATAAEIARTLLRAGAGSVDVWVVARTPRPDDA